MQTLTITLKSYAKINLSIDVLGKLPNGYHSIRTVMQQVDLFDTVSVSARRDRAEARVSLSAQALSADVRGLPADESNIAVRAAHAFLAAFAPEFRGTVAIRLQKNIPLAAGLAGGSGNAAAVLLALARIFKGRDEEKAKGFPIHIENLMELGSRIGADVPFCIMGQTALNPALGPFTGPSGTCALAEGMGERLTPLPSPRGFALIVKPPIAVSTAAVYGGFDPADIKDRPDTDALVAAIYAGDDGKIRKNMVNVLEIGVLKEYPEIADIKYRLAADASAECALMSGSGSSVFAWYRDRSACARAFDEIRREKGCVYMAELLR
jgi:4-diphosphocytidyl-2-C-methyl-D-erythritol kinase